MHQDMEEYPLVELKTYIQELIIDVRSQIDTVMKDMTDEQFNWKPSGTANPISAIFIHLVGAEDDFIQAVLQHRPPCWEEQAWGVKIGIPTPPMPGHGWHDAVTAPLKVIQLRAYEQEVHAATDAYLAKLTDEELNRKVTLFSEVYSVSGVLKLLVVHNACHVGEIAAIKGMQGVKVLPY